MATCVFLISGRISCNQFRRVARASAYGPRGRPVHYSSRHAACSREKHLLEHVMSQRRKPLKAVRAACLRGRRWGVSVGLPQEVCRRIEGDRRAAVRDRPPLQRRAAEELMGCERLKAVGGARPQRTAPQRCKRRCSSSSGVASLAAGFADCPSAPLCTSSRPVLR